MFFHPWAIALGVLAAGLPIAVHILTKPRPVRMPLSTLRFVRQSLRQRRARHRLRDFLVLALRTLAVLLVALAVARPKFIEQPMVSPDSVGDAARVVILDVSQSMAAVEGGVERIERARSAAQSYLRYSPGLRVNLIQAGAKPRAVFEQLSQNFEVISDELGRSTALVERLDINSAIESAAEMLAPYAGDEDKRLEIVVVSDFQRSNWAGADFSILPKETKIQLEAATSSDQLANVGVLGATIRAAGATGKEAQLEVEVGNYSSAARKVSVEAMIEGVASRMEGECPAGRRTTLSRTVRLTNPGWHVGEAKLVGIEDALAADDCRGFTLEIADTPQYAMLTRQPASMRPSSSYFLEAALTPLEGARVDPLDLDRGTVSDADMIVIDHPGKIEAEDIRFLGGLMRRGRGVLYVASETVDATNLRLLTETLGGGLQMPVEFMPPRQSTERSGLFLASYRSSQPPFDVFGEGVRTVTDSLRFERALASRRLEDSLDDDLLATYSDGTACLVMTATDAGKLAVLNADLARSNLPTNAAFVPLLDRLVQHLLAGRESSLRAKPGELVVARLPESVGAPDTIEVQPTWSDTPSNEGVGEFSYDRQSVLWRWPSPERPGVYRVLQGGKTVFALPIGIAAEESSLETLPADVLTERLAGDSRSQYRVAGSQNADRDTVWTWLMAACVVAMISEVICLSVLKS